MTDHITGYASIDRPWLKYYSEAAVDTPIPHCTAYDYLLESNRDDMDDVALSYYDRKITYHELFEEIDKCSHALSSIGLKNGDMVVIAAVTIPEIIYAFYACNRLGIITNMVDPRTGIDGIREYVREVEAKCIIALDVVYSRIAKAIDGLNVETVITVSPAESLTTVKRTAYKLINKVKGKTPRLSKECVAWKDFIKRGEGSEYTTPPYVENTCCVIVHTGGTTGSPKGVMLSNENINTMALQYRLLGVNYSRDQRFLNIMPPFIAYGIVCGIHVPLTVGLTDVLIPLLDPNKFADLVLKYKPAHMLGVPSHFEKMRTSRKMKNVDLSFFESTGAGGDGIPSQFEEEINEFLKEHNSRYAIAKGYGMTEISSAAVASHGMVNKFQSAGVPHLKTIVSVFKPGTDEELTYGETGEICMTAPTVMLGYYGKKEETDKILIRHKDGKLWLHSRDIGHMDEDGFLYIDGRIKRIIVRYDGFKVFPSMVENVVSGHPAIESCCAVGTADTMHLQGKLPLVYVVLKEGEKQNFEKIKSEIIDICEQALPEYAQPIDIVCLEELPKTPIGKIDFQALEELTHNTLLT